MSRKSAHFVTINIGRQGVAAILRKEEVLMRSRRLVVLGFGITVGLMLTNRLDSQAGDPNRFQTIAAVIKALDDEDPEIRQNLAIALAKLSPESIDPLCRALRDPSPRRRAGAALALGLIGTAAGSALTSLVESLPDSDREVRRQVSFAISQIVSDQRIRPTVGLLGQP
jgi:HEAT repeat protein